MKKIYYLIVALSINLIPLKLIAQNGKAFKVKAMQSKQDVINLVDTCLLRGLQEKGLVSNINFVGKAISVGYYENGETLNFQGCNRGIVMTTGMAEKAIGPNNTGGASFGNGGKGDKDCNILAGNKTRDAAVITFDFMPSASNMSFHYIWASEEYSKFVKAEKRDTRALFNDVFGFFVSGEGIDGIFWGNNKAKNIALVPFTQKYVGIGTINCGYESDYKKEPPGKSNPNDGEYCYLLTWNNRFKNPAYCQYNCYTHPLTAQTKVEKCKVYHMKLVVSDDRDDKFDSAVFLEAGSFNIGNLESELESSIHAADDYAIANCNEIKVKFKLNEALTEDLTVPLDYSKSEAVSGVDYKHDEIAYSLDKLFIPKGELEASTYIAVADNANIPEKGKEVLIRFSPTICENAKKSEQKIILMPLKPIDQKVDFKFTDPLSSFKSNTLNVECDDKVNCSVLLNGGHPPYEYEWSLNALSGKSKDFQFEGKDANSGELKLTFVDQCESNREENIYKVEIGGIDLELEVSNPTPCQGEKVVFTAMTNAKESDIKWSTGETGKKEITIIASEDIDVSCFVPSGCNSDKEQSKTKPIKVILPLAQVEPEEAKLCPGDKIKLKASDGKSFLWSTGETTQEIEVNPTEDINKYTVSVVNVCDDKADAESMVYVNNTIDAIITSNKDNHTICRGDKITLHGEGGQGIEWSCDGDVISDNPDHTFTPEMDLKIKLKVYDVCNDSAYVNIIVNPVPDLKLENVLVEGCVPFSAQINNFSEDNFPGGLKYKWFLDDSEISTEKNFSYEFEEDGIYNLGLEIETDKGCLVNKEMPELIKAFASPDSDIIHEYQEFFRDYKEYSFVSEKDLPDWIYDWLIVGPNSSYSSTSSQVSYAFEEYGDFFIKLKVTNENNCSSEYVVEFKVQEVNSFFWIPTAFSPNKDGKNDYFYVKLEEKIVEKFDIGIYNRWGQRVFSSKDYTKKWDGMYNGEYVDAGPYAIKLQVKFLNGVEVVKSQILYVVR
ncbi:MAG: choice-of-anchor L domain-containing protein [Bacteroidales bacterium]